jgi:phosphoribosylformylglycinamidine synthase
LGNRQQAADFGFAAGCPLSAAREALMKARIRITLKNGVLDPQGKAIQNALAALGISGVEDVRQGKYIEVRLAETSEERAKETIERMCKDLLANSVIENYAYELQAA